MRRETEINNEKMKSKITYAEAVKRVKQSRSSGRSIRGEAATEKGWIMTQEFVKERGEKREWVEKRDLVIFIAGVINATAEVKSKTDRIQIIAKAAIQHLGMGGLKWEEIRDGLSVASASQEGSIG